MKKLTILLIVLLTLTCLLCSCASSDYKEAEALLAAGDYVAARTIYENLQTTRGGMVQSAGQPQPVHMNYRDCNVKIARCNYLEAEDLLAAGDFASARELYRLLEENGPYEDAAEKIFRCNYLEGEACLEKMDYLHAFALFSALGDWQDAATRAQEAAYALANQFAANENYAAEAIRYFAKCRGYQQADALMVQCAEPMLQNAQVGDSVFYGVYEQDNNLENGPEPIEWVVLGKSEDNLCLFSQYIIDRMKFGRSHYWEGCSLRIWLNEEFLTTAFTEQEQARIQPMITSQETHDTVFLLSAEEARGFYASNEARVGYLTDYVNPLNSEDPKEGPWWTRSVSTASNGKGVVIVENDGNVRSAGCAPDVPNEYSKMKVGVRPTICLSISGEITEEPQNMSLFGYNSNTSLDREPNMWGSTGGGGGKCIVCNGTGSVRYYYGSSDLEAWLDGYDSFTVGPCTSCDGTGKG